MSKCQRSIKVVTVQKPYERAPVQVNRQLWNSFRDSIFSYISFRFLSAPPLEVPQMEWEQRHEYARSESSWKREGVQRRLRRLFSHLFERMISHLHTIRKTLCSLWPGVISRADKRRRCAGSRSSTITAAVWRWPPARTAGVTLINHSRCPESVHVVFSLTSFGHGLSLVRDGASKCFSPK